jgi:DNA repair protein RecO (recombination protein O)
LNTASRRRGSASRGHAVVGHSAFALLLRRVDTGDADAVLTLLTDKLGRVSAVARSARASKKRFAGALEPMHTLRVELEERPSSDLMLLKEATLAVPRHRLVQSLESIEAAGRVLRWVRHAAPAHTPEPELWRVTSDLLDTLDRSLTPQSPGPHLAHAGLQILVALGWGLDLVHCVRCGRTCEPGRRAMIDSARGGLVCRACGGADLILESDVRTRLVRASAGEPALEQGDVPCALSLVEGTLRAHAGWG